MTQDKFFIRKGTAEDIPAVHRLICELAEFERAPHEVTNTPKQMLIDGFGSNPIFLMWVAVREENIVGMALCYTRYSTWKGRMLYLEDIVVNTQYRNQGIGRSLFETCMKHSVEGDFAGMIWQVLDWNADAIRFYNRFNADLDNGWINGKLMRLDIERYLSTGNLL